MKENPNFNNTYLNPPTTEAQRQPQIGPQLEIDVDPLERMADDLSRKMRIESPGWEPDIYS